MENGNILSKENLSKRIADQENATEHLSFIKESKNSTIKDMSERDDRYTIKGKNSFPNETAKRSNGILKTSESSSNGSNEKKDKSIQNLQEGAVTKIPTVDQPGKTRLLPNEVPSDRSKREIKIPGKIGNMATSTGTRPLCNIIGKREQRREELEKIEGELRQRLDMLECSMPAVMVWNIWRMSQDAPVCRMKRILEKQFKDARELSCRSTPSRHYDSRVRDAEAERKLALKKMEEARTLWSEKLAKLEEKRRKLEEAKRIREEQKNAIERLSEEAKVLREEMEKQRDAQQDGSCQYGECGDMKCKKRWLDKVSSVMSIESGDIQCLEKIQQLAEEEVIMKRDIAELERREETYMRTLQHADELWSKMEGDVVSTTSTLKQQLDMKTAANQQLADRVCELEDALEKCRTKLAECRTQLEKFLSIEKVEATIGRDDDVAEVTDKEVAVRTRVVHRPIGRVDDVATVKDDEVSVRVEVTDEETFARPTVIDADAEAAFVGDDKDVSVKPDVIDLAVDRPTDLVQIEDAESAVRPEDFSFEQQKLKEVRQYLAQIGSLEELYKEGEPCPPDFVCDGVVTSPTGMTDEELIALGLDSVAPIKKIEKKVPSDEERERLLREELAKKADYAVNDIEKKEEKIDKILGIEIEGKFVERADERIAETPVREIVTRPAIQEKVADNSSITMPDDVKPEIKTIEQGIVIQRDIILSWIDTIDTIRTETARHPNCHAAKKDADILAKQVGVYIEIKPKKIEEETVITAEKKDKDTKDEEKVNFKIETEEKFEEKDEIGFIPEIVKKLPTGDVITEAQVEPPIALETIEKTKVTAEEAEDLFIKQEIIDSTEIKAPKEPKIAESELRPDLTKEKIPTDVEPFTTVSIEEEEEPTTISLKEDLEDETIQLIKPDAHKVEYERIEIKNKIPVEETVQITKELETPQVNEEEKTSTIYKEEDIKQIRKEVADISKEAAIEEVKDEVSKETDESKLAEGGNEIEKLKETPQLDKIKTTNAKGATPYVEITKTKEIAETPSVVEIKEIGHADVKEKTPIMDFKEMKEIVPEPVSPTAELTKIEKVKPSKLPVDTEKSPIADIAEKEIKVEEPSQIMYRIEEKIEVEQPPILDAIITEKVESEEPVLPSDVIEEKIEVAEPPPKEEVKVEEPLSTADKITEKIERIQPVTESPPIIKDKKQEIEATEQPALEVKPKLEEDEKLEKTPKELTLLTELSEEEKVTEKIEMIQPVTEPSPTIKEEMQEIESVLKVKSEQEEDKKMEQIPQKLTELTEEEKEAVEREKVLKVIPPTKPLEEVTKEEVQKKPEIVEAEKLIPITETKPIEEGMPALQIDLRAAPQQYFIIAKIQEKEVVQILPMMTPQCMACCSRSPAETTEPVAITRAEVVQTEVEQTEIAQTEVTQTEIAQTEVAQTEIMQTELVQISTQTVSAVESAPTRIISEYLKASELKAIIESSTKIVGGRPEITGRKMLEHKRLRDQSTVTTVSIGSQTVETSHVSHERAVRDERERARVPTNELLRALKIAARRTRLDTEREIRTINYGGKSDEIAKQQLCNCCLCGKTSSSSSSIRPGLQIPQIDMKTVKPPAAIAASKRTPPKISLDPLISYDRLCPDCKANLLSKMSEKKRDIEQIIKVISRKKRTIEKRDQSCLAKIPKRKTDLVKQKSKDNLPSVLEDTEKSGVKLLSSSCVCFKLEKSDIDPIREGNCYCAE